MIPALEITLESLAPQIKRLGVDCEIANRERSAIATESLKSKFIYTLKDITNVIRATFSGGWAVSVLPLSTSTLSEFDFIEHRGIQVACPATMNGKYIVTCHLLKDASVEHHRLSKAIDDITLFLSAMVSSPVRLQSVTKSMDVPKVDPSVVDASANLAKQFSGKNRTKDKMTNLFSNTDELIESVGVFNTAAANINSIDVKAFERKIGKVVDLTNALVTDIADRDVSNNMVKQISEELYNLGHAMQQVGITRSLMEDVGINLREVLDTVEKLK